jgi:purine-binding chemotaxis protein CheW
MTQTVALDTVQFSGEPLGAVDGEISQQNRSHLSLLCRVKPGVLCALPLAHVEETMRPLAVQPMAGLPWFISGIAVIRGVPTPVVNVASLLTGEAAPALRFVTIKTGRRHLVLAVDAVLGVAEIPPGSIGALPDLLHNAELDAISAIGVLNAELLLVLRTTLLIPADVWTAIQAGCSAA